MGFAAGDANLGRYVQNEVISATDSNGLEDGRAVEDYYRLRITQAEIAGEPMTST